VLEIRSILAPTDFSQHAQGAVRYACGLAERLGATLHLLHVLPDVIVPVGPDPSLVTSVPPEYYTETEGQSREALGRVVQPDWPQPAGVVVEVRWGDPVDAVAAYARDRGVDLLVLSTHGRTGLSHALMGSVAERILREAPCPVLTIRNRRP
jgi:nucleotide-binding universal stress UspA family protein